MIAFKSVAVLDLETTSLPKHDHNTTKITELAVLGCEIEHLKNSKELPRVLHKLTLLFNPEKTIDPYATKVSGLSNEMLMNVKPFTKESAEALEHFLERLPSPVCIIAHNGDEFDFPILRRTLQIIKKNLPEHVRCADSLKAFRELYPKPSTTKSLMQKKNETTPKHQRTQQVDKVPVKRPRRFLFHKELEAEDDNEIFPDNSEFSEWASSQESGENKSDHPKSYRLIDIYQFFFNENFPHAHRAEEDCIALLNCLIQCDNFWDWISNNSVTFNSIQPLF